MTIKPRTNPVNIDELLVQLQPTAKKLSDGNASFSNAFLLRQITGMLFDSIESDKIMPEEDLRDGVEHALFNMVKVEKFTRQELFKQLDSFQKKYFEKRLRINYFATTISVTGVHKPIRVPILNTLIEVSQVPPIKIQRGLVNLNNEIKLDCELPNDYSSVVVKVNARTVHGAFHRAQESLDVFRGIWNLHFDSPYRETWGGRKDPVNRILQGPISTLHKASGSRIMDFLWYESNYSGSISPINLLVQGKKLLDFQSDTLKLVQNCKYKEVIYEALARYCRALDSRDFSASYAKLWSVLELLTDFQQGDSHDVCIKRAGYLLTPHDQSQFMLKSLRDYRNKIVHADRYTSEDELYLYQLKKYVYQLFVFHLRSPRPFRTLDDAILFLEATPQLSQIGMKLSQSEFDIKSMQNKLRVAKNNRRVLLDAKDYYTKKNAPS